MVGTGILNRVVRLDIIKVRFEQRLEKGMRKLAEQALGGRPFRQKS